ncbi:hypothetical protein HPB48_012529 [Haemaphysalis longicornis]|uniref:Reverse transcriptase domain-containing protein n=1 Tax=Haemaphysalis longicornis TaxID=44386 RepID=A0A9J6FI28_HAELO|nr:hypothetical protein HPB48_012529 [Haemaphysalis longicornis]
MARLPTYIISIPDLHFTTYADDITLWSHKGSVGEQAYMLQQGIDAVRNFLRDVGMQASPEKLEYVVVPNGPNFRAQPTRELFSFKLNNQPFLANHLLGY